MRSTCSESRSAPAASFCSINSAAVCDAADQDLQEAEQKAEEEEVKQVTQELYMLSAVRCSALRCASMLTKSSCARCQKIRAHTAADPCVQKASNLGEEERTAQRAAMQ